MIRVLVTDDSETARHAIVTALESDPDIRVIATASNGLEAVALTLELRPDLVTMDVNMPKLDGLAATQRIMAQCPTPVVIVSRSVELSDTDVAFNAMRDGALEVIAKPRELNQATFRSFRDALVGAVRTMWEIPMVRRRRGTPTLRPIDLPPRRFRVVAVGASTGGPKVLAGIFSNLPANIGCPILVVQHMTAGFTEAFAAWLAGQCSELRVKLAEDGEGLLPGTVYIAPDGLGFEMAEDWRVSLTDEPEPGFHHPSAELLFQSVARVAGKSAIGIVLTGMGSDGAKGLLAMRRAGSWTLAQDPESCVIDGMPNAARELNAVEKSLDPETIIRVLARLDSEV